MLNLIEKLINEHGSSTILKERLGLIQDEYMALQRQRDNFYAENTTLKQEINNLKIDRDALDQELNALKKGSHATYVCDHCGSPDLERTGNRPNRQFGRLGIKDMIFTCNVCNKESAFMPNPQQQP